VRRGFFNVQVWLSATAYFAILSGLYSFSLFVSLFEYPPTAGANEFGTSYLRLSMTPVSPLAQIKPNFGRSFRTLWQLCLQVNAQSPQRH